MSQLEDEALRHQPGALIELALEADYADYLKEHYTNYRSRLEDLEQLATFARQFPSTQEFLAQLALLTNLEAGGRRPAEDTEDRVGGGVVALLEHRDEKLAQGVRPLAAGDVLRPYNPGVRRLPGVPVGCGTGLNSIPPSVGGVLTPLLAARFHNSSGLANRLCGTSIESSR